MTTSQNRAGLRRRSAADPCDGFKPRPVHHHEPRAAVRELQLLVMEQAAGVSVTRCPPAPYVPQPRWPQVYLVDDAAGLVHPPAARRSEHDLVSRLARALVAAAEEESPAAAGASFPAPREDNRTVVSVAPYPPSTKGRARLSHRDGRVPRHERYARILPGMTVDDCLRAGATERDVRWAVASGLVVVA